MNDFYGILYLPVFNQCKQGRTQEGASGLKSTRNNFFCRFCDLNFCTFLTTNTITIIDPSENKSWVRPCMYGYSG